MKSTTYQEISCLALLLSAVRRNSFFGKNCQIDSSVKFVFLVFSHSFFVALHEVAEVGSLSARAKMPTKVFVRRVFPIFATNASFLHVIAILQI